MRIHVSGRTNEILDAVATDVRELISGLNPDGDGRIFYLTELELHNSGTVLGEVHLYDSDETTALAVGDALTRGTYFVPANDTLILTFPDGTKPFVTNLTAGTVNGTYASGECGASGYLA